MTKKFDIINGSFRRLKLRTDENIIFFPFLFFISFQFVFILTTHIINGSNPRAGNPSNPIEYQTNSFPDVPLWFSVTPIGDEIVVTTAQRKVFKWKQANQDLEPLRTFMLDLKEMAETEIKSVSLSNRFKTEKTTALIAADRHLTYAHLKPIILVLAEIGIRNYAFETKLTHVGAK